jgi:hypothetical protein
MWYQCTKVDSAAQAYLERGGSAPLSTVAKLRTRFKL